MTDLNPGICSTSERMKQNNSFAPKIVKRVHLLSLQFPFLMEQYVFRSMHIEAHPLFVDVSGDHQRVLPARLHGHWCTALGERNPDFGEESSPKGRAIELLIAVSQDRDQRLEEELPARRVVMLEETRPLLGRVVQDLAVGTPKRDLKCKMLRLVPICWSKKFFSRVIYLVPCIVLV